MKLLLLALCFALVLPSCAGDKALLITGDSLVTVADTFVATAAAMDAALEAKTVTPAAYRDWAAFGRKFQAAYPLAKNLWSTAADHHDEKLQAQASAVVAQLAADLGAYATLVGVKL